MPRPRPAQDPPLKYDSAQESLYRNEMEEYLYSLSSEVDGVTSGKDKRASAAIKRATLTIPALGIVRLTGS